MNKKLNAELWESACVCVCVYALIIVSRDKILLFENTFIIIIGRVSEAGLLEWMRFVTFQQRSCERPQRTYGPISE